MDDGTPVSAQLEAAGNVVTRAQAASEDARLEAILDAACRSVHLRARAGASPAHGTTYGSPDAALAAAGVGAAHSRNIVNASELDAILDAVLCERTDSPLSSMDDPPDASLHSAGVAVTPHLVAQDSLEGSATPQTSDPLLQKLAAAAAAAAGGGGKEAQEADVTKQRTLVAPRECSESELISAHSDRDAQKHGGEQGAEGAGGPATDPSMNDVARLTQFGISIDGLRHALVRWPEITDQTTTSDLCHAFIKPDTVPCDWTDKVELIDSEKRWYKHLYVHCGTGKSQSNAPSGTVSFCEHLLMDPALSKFVGKPTHFLSHAWLYKFKNVLSALDSFVKRQPKDSAEVFFWFDCFCIDEHASQIMSQDWWSTTFKDAIASMGHTVMVLSPWSNPQPLTRAWCLWELYCTVQTDSQFSVCLGQDEVDDFETQLLDDTQIVLDVFSRIDVANAEAGNPADKEMILSAVQETAGGCQALNGIAMAAMREWVQLSIERLLEKLLEHKGWIFGSGAAEMERFEAITQVGCAFAQSLGFKGQRDSTVTAAQSVFEKALAALSTFPDNTPGHWVELKKTRTQQHLAGAMRMTGRGTESMLLMRSVVATYAQVYALAQSFHATSNVEASLLVDGVRVENRLAKTQFKGCLEFTGRLELTVPSFADVSPIVNSVSVAKAVAVVHLGGCTIVEKVNNVSAAGAIALIIVNNDDEHLAIQVESATIPVLVVRSCDGPLLERSQQATLNIDMATLESPQLDVVTDQSRAAGLRDWAYNMSSSEQQLRSIKEDHLRAQANLAGMHKELSQYEDAATLLRSSVAGLAELCEADNSKNLHRSLQQRREDLAMCILQGWPGDQEARTEAMTILHSVVDNQAQLLGEDHFYTLRAKGALSQCLLHTVMNTPSGEQQSDQIKRALELQRQVVDGYTAQLGAVHANTLTQRANLNTILTLVKGCEDEAKANAEEILSGQLQAYGPTDPRIAQTLMTMALSALRSGDEQQAQGLLGKIKVIAEAAPSAQHKAKLQLVVGMLESQLQSLVLSSAPSGVGS
jgi:hypothetical protein